MFGSSLLPDLQALVAHLDPDAVEPADAARMVTWFAAVKNVAAAGEALMAKRVADSGAWQSSGARSEADWLAKKTGASVGAARASLDTARRMDAAPEVAEAIKRGDLSVAQADANTAAVAAAPAAGPRLLALAEQQSLTKLKDECARVRAAAVADPPERHREIHRKRFFRTWNDADGARCGMYKATPEAAAAIERAVKPYADAAFETARKQEAHEPSEAYAFDGLLAMATDRSGAGCGAEGRRKRAEAIVLVNLESLQRGSVEPGELCEIPGVGPVPVDVARDLLGDALLRVVIHDGVDVLTAVHAGRLASDVQRTAIQVRQRGRCARPTCNHRIDEIDHVRGWIITRATSLEDLGGLCRFDHLAKTHHGHSYRRTELGWVWTRPDGTEEHERPPP
jgi:hypothetical protein